MGRAILFQITLVMQMLAEACLCDPLHIPEHPNMQTSCKTFVEVTVSCADGE